MCMQDYPSVASSTLSPHAQEHTSTSTVVLEYIKGNSRGQDLLHLEQDLELRKASLPFPRHSIAQPSRLQTTVGRYNRQLDLQTP